MGQITQLQMQHDEDPREVLLKELGGFQNNIELFGARVLVATYRRPTVTKGGIFLTDKALDEDIFQGAVGLVIGLGPLAFKDSGDTTFGGRSLSIGDWCFYQPAEGKGIGVNGAHCRIFEDTRIGGKISHPDLVF